MLSRVMFRYRPFQEERTSFHALLWAIHLFLCLTAKFNPLAWGWPLKFLTRQDKRHKKKRKVSWSAHSPSLLCRLSSLMIRIEKSINKATLKNLRTHGHTVILQQLLKIMVSLFLVDQMPH